MRHPTFTCWSANAKQVSAALIALLVLAACDRDKIQPTPPRAGPSRFESLAETRDGFKTKLAPTTWANPPLAVPPPGVFNLVHYPASPGKFAAYLTADPGDGKKHPAILWITGGDCNSIGPVWEDAPAENDQTAAAYRKAGIVMMFPSLRGGNDNPGVREGFLGEVNDVLDAATFLAQQSYVDSRRIYLGGHSTGGTLALLVTECSDRFRCVFSFGPVGDVSGYDTQFTPFNRSIPREVELRSPKHWLDSIQTPTYVLEGTENGNIGPLRAMAATSTNAKIHFLPVPTATHRTVLAPTNALIAQKILNDTGATCGLTLTEAEVNTAFRQAHLKSN